MKPTSSIIYFTSLPPIQSISNSNSSSSLSRYPQTSSQSNFHLTMPSSHTLQTLLPYALTVLMLAAYISRRMAINRQIREAEAAGLTYVPLCEAGKLAVQGINAYPAVQRVEKEKPRSPYLGKGKPMREIPGMMTTGSF